MSKTLVPQGGRGSQKCRRAGVGLWQGVEISSAIAAKHHAPRRKVLDRKTESIKLYRAMIVAGELTNRK